MRIAIYGANSRSLALANVFLKPDVVVSVILDGDERLISAANPKFLFLDKERIENRYCSVPIDLPDKCKQYEFDYIVIFAGSINTGIREDIAQTLYSMGIEKRKVIFWAKLIKSGLIGMDFYWREPYSYLSMLNDAKKEGIDEEAYLSVAEELLDVSERIFCDEYRLFILKIFVNSLRGAINRENILFENIKMDYRAFTINPQLFVYEAADIFLDVLRKGMTRIDAVEGPYQNGRVYIGKDDVVIDAGANVGIFSSVAASQTRGTVYAFEPVKNNMDILKYSAGIYGNIVPFCAALGSVNGKSEISVSEYETNHGAASMMNIQSKSKTEEIEVITLDEFARMNHLKRVDFIKVDIEGAERLMLMGAEEVLRKYAPKLSICTYHSKEDPALLAFLIKQFNPDYVIEHAYCKMYAYVP